MALDFPRRYRTDPAKHLEARTKRSRLHYRRATVEQLENRLLLSLGRQFLKNINRSADTSDAGALTNVNGTLFFTAASGDGATGRELCKSGGTIEGAVLVKEIAPGTHDAFSDGGLVRVGVNVNGTVFFAANNELNGQELWKSDGTEAGTVLVKDTWPGTNWGTPQLLL